MRKELLGLMVTALMLSGCQNSGNVPWKNLSTFGDSSASLDDLSSLAYYPSDDLIAHGKVQFSERNYGRSYKLFKKAASVYPNDPQAWLGYAASADNLGRFDNADRAYQQLSRMIPDRPEYLNNVGYSYLLRGQLQQARAYFLKAYELDPGNEITANNLELLRDSATLVRRG